MKKKKKTIEKEFFLSNLRLLFSARENVLTNFKSTLFPTKDLNKVSTREPMTELVRKPTTEEI